MAHLLERFAGYCWAKSVVRKKEQLKLRSIWDPLTSGPCFEKIVASLAPKLLAVTLRS
jgi:hypothetical protein